MRDAVKSIASQILSTHVTLGIDMVLANTGAVGRTVAETITGETAKTAAVTVGVSARTAAEGAGGVAAAATTIASVLKSIYASAGETFAGIFGFLSPVLGPGAAVPAALGQATVMAVGT